MIRDDVIRLYLQVADELAYGKDWGWGVGENGPLHRFANLVAAAEREACAQICDEHADDPVYCGQAIRARGNT